MKTTEDPRRASPVVLGLSPDAPIPVARAARRLRKVVRSAITKSLWISGEVSELRRDIAGNTRFALEDGGCRMACIIWVRDTSPDTAALENGTRLAVLAQIGVYERESRIQATVTAARLDGEGAAKRRRERVRQRLRRDGLLDPRRKRPLPFYPRGVAVITSRTGAALQDILAVARRRHAGVPILVAPAVVQGDAAPASIIRALGIAQCAEACDVVIIARGGGASADLDVFNDESVARAIAACRIPVVTAIGHETDVLIADEVADLRAGTPSIAAERAIPDRNALARALVHSADRLRHALASRVARSAARLQRSRVGIERTVSVRMQRQRLRLTRVQDQLARGVDRRMQRSRSDLRRHAQSLDRFCTGRIARERARLERLTVAMSALDPTSVLSRGYAILSDERGRVLSSIVAVRSATTLTIRMHDGELVVDRSVTP